MMAKSLEGATFESHPSIFMSSDSAVKRLIVTIKKYLAMFTCVVQLEIIIVLFGQIDLNSFSSSLQ